MIISLAWPPASRTFTRWLVSLTLVFGLCAQAQTGTTRLRYIDQLKQSMLTGQGSAESLTVALLTDTYNSDLTASNALTSEIVTAEKLFLADPASSQITDVDIVLAFDRWQALISAAHTMGSPYDLHMFRMFLGSLAPSLISKDKEGLTSIHLSPVEAVYLLDLLIAHGTIPKTSHLSAKANVAGYNEAYDTYVRDTPASKRQADIQNIVEAYLLKIQR